MCQHYENQKVWKTLRNLCNQRETFVSLRLNSQRLKAFNQFDFRIAKKINFKRKTLDFYLDVQNALGFTNQTNPDFTFQRTSDNSGFKTTDGKEIKQDGSNAVPLILQNNELTITPTLGLIFEF